MAGSRKRQVKKAGALSALKGPTCRKHLLSVDGKQNCLVYGDPKSTWQQRLNELLQKSASIELPIGLHAVKIEDGFFSFWGQASSNEPEPFVLLRISCSKPKAFRNLKTGCWTSVTYVTLNGYEDVLVLEVAKTPTRLSAFYLDCYAADNWGKVSLTVSICECRPRRLIQRPR